MIIIQAVTWLVSITYNYKYYVNKALSTVLVMDYTFTTHMILVCPLLLDLIVTQLSSVCWV